jgi:DNA-directed RNA polymerase subunit M
MPSWTCPNTKCPYDKQLEPGQYCPLCGEQAKEFNSSELGNLWSQKWDFKKSIERTKKREQALGRVKFCPRCGSSNINFLIFYRPSIWKCLNCGYEGAFIIEDGQLAEKIRENYSKK